MKTEDAIFSELGFCGCGNSTPVLPFIQKGLQLIKDCENSDWSPSTCINLRVFLNEEPGSRYFFLYVMDAKGYTEHGVSVPGWLTKKGEQLLEDLKQLNSNVLPT